MMHIPTPEITAATDSQKLQQLQSYLYRLAQQLNWALETLEAEIARANQTKQS